VYNLERWCIIWNDSGLLEHDTPLLGKWRPTFWRNVLPSSSRAQGSWRMPVRAEKQGYIGKVWPVDVIGGEPTGRCGRWTLNPWRWRKNIPLKWSEPLTQQCSITIQKTRTSITLIWKSQNSRGYVARRPHQVTIQMSFELQCKHNQNTKNVIW